MSWKFNNDVVTLVLYTPYNHKHMYIMWIALLSVLANNNTDAWCHWAIYLSDASNNYPVFLFGMWQLSVLLPTSEIEAINMFCKNRRSLQLFLSE